MSALCDKLERAERYHSSIDNEQKTHGRRQNDFHDRTTSLAESGALCQKSLSLRTPHPGKHWSGISSNRVPNATG